MASIGTTEVVALIALIAVSYSIMLRISNNTGTARASAIFAGIAGLVSLYMAIMLETMIQVTDVPVIATTIWSFISATIGFLYHVPLEISGLVLVVSFLNFILMKEGFVG